jgi:hypothetical protein
VPVPKCLLVITGSMGAGKTAVLGEMSDILAQHNMAHASIDMDGLGGAHLPPKSDSDAAMFANLKCICANYRAMGLERFVVARAVEDAHTLHRICTIIPARQVSVGRLAASIETMEERIRAREGGILRGAFVARVSQLNTILDQAHVEHFTVVNEGRSVTDVALEVLAKANWIAPQP